MHHSNLQSNACDCRLSESGMAHSLRIRGELGKRRSVPPETLGTGSNASAICARQLDRMWLVWCSSHRE
jgi:hypothetical protein